MQPISNRAETSELQAPTGQLIKAYYKGWNSQLEDLTQGQYQASLKAGVARLPLLTQSI